MEPQQIPYVYIEIRIYKWLDAVSILLQETSPPLNEAGAIVVDQFDGETGLSGEIIKDVNERRDALFEDEWGVEQGAGKDFMMVSRPLKAWNMVMNGYTRANVCNPQRRTEVVEAEAKVFARTHSISISTYHEYTYLHVPPTAFHDNATPTKYHQRGKCTTLLLHAPSKEDVRMVPIQGAV